MEVLKKGIRSYPQDPTRFFEFTRFNQICGEFVLIEGFIDFQELVKIRAEISASNADAEKKLEVMMIEKNAEIDKLKNLASSLKTD